MKIVALFAVYMLTVFAPIPVEAKKDRIAGRWLIIAAKERGVWVSNVTPAVWEIGKDRVTCWYLAYGEPVWFVPRVSKYRPAGYDARLKGDKLTLTMDDGETEYVFVREKK